MTMASTDVTQRYKNRHAFIHERVLALIARETEEHGSMCASKNDLAENLDCCVRSIDRAIQRLKREGMVTVQAEYGPKGGQLGNSYRTTRKGAKIARQFLCEAPSDDAQDAA